MMAACAFAQTYDLQVMTELDLGHNLGQFRAVPISLGADKKAVAAMYSQDAEIDPYIGMFFFPKQEQKGGGCYSNQISIAEKP